MSQDRWSAVIARITKTEADTIDDLAGPLDVRTRPQGRPLFPSGMGPLMPQATFKSATTACIGVRITEARADIADVAAHLAALALEKDAEIVVLNHLPYCGLERFGFRCERVVGANEDERAACEEQIRRFWNIEIVI